MAGGGCVLVRDAGLPSRVCDVAAFGPLDPFTTGARSLVEAEPFAFAALPLLVRVETASRPPRAAVLGFPPRWGRGVLKTTVGLISKFFHFLLGPPLSSWASFSPASGFSWGLRTVSSVAAALGSGQKETSATGGKAAEVFSSFSFARLPRGALLRGAWSVDCVKSVGFFDGWSPFGPLVDATGASAASGDFFERVSDDTGAPAGAVAGFVLVDCLASIRCAQTLTAGGGASDKTGFGASSFFSSSCDFSLWASFSRGFLDFRPFLPSLLSLAREVRLTDREPFSSVRVWEVWESAAVDSPSRRVLLSCSTDGAEGAGVASDVRSRSCLGTAESASSLACLPESRASASFEVTEGALTDVLPVGTSSLTDAGAELDVSCGLGWEMVWPIAACA